MRRRKRLRPGAHLERFRIARGAINDIRPFVAAILTLVPVGFLIVPALLGALGASTGAAFTSGIATMVLGLFGVLVFLNLPGKVHLGDDGVFVDTRDRRTFVPFGEIESIDRYEDVVMGKHLIGVLLGLRDGAELKLPFGEDQFGASHRVEALLGRLREAHGAFVARAGSSDAAAQLEPGDASTDRWAERLRRLGAGGEVGPRVAPVPGEHLWRVVEDPRAAAAARAGAAFALRGQLDAPARVRLREVARTTAAPELHAALAAAAEEEEAAAVEALEAVRARRVP